MLAAYSATDKGMLQACGQRFSTSNRKQKAISRSVSTKYESNTVEVFKSLYFNFCNISTFVEGYHEVSYGCIPNIRKTRFLVLAHEV
jgi:hypothetical protein